MKNKTNFNWNRITPEEFEKLVFFLLDDMGYKSLTWRKGGKGVYATDGGRDLEATYVKVEPDDSITVENWWIEVKYRSGGLSKSTVQQIVNNASGRRDVDVFAIVTNTAISNPTLDWIKEFQNSQGRPRIVVWQQHDIERILRKYPRTAADFFTLSLSIAERLEIIKERFWDALIYPSIDEVEELWVNFSSLSWSASNLLPVIAAEAAMGKLDARKWGLIIDEELLTETLLLGLINVTFLGIRSEQHGQRQLPLQHGLEYLLQVALLRLDLNDVLTLLLDLYKHTDIEKSPPPELANLILSPIVSNIYRDLAINCAKDCQRFRLSIDRANQSEKTNFHRFAANFTQDFDNGEPIVLINSRTEECKLELVPLGDFCPLGDDIPENIMDEATLEKFLSTIQKIIRKRVEDITN